MLNAFETRFQLLEDLVRLRLRREGLLHSPSHPRQPGRRRKSLLKPRAKRGIMAPAPRPPPEWNTGHVIQIETPGGQLEEVTLPPKPKTSEGKPWSSGRELFSANQQTAPRCPAPRTFGIEFCSNKRGLTPVNRGTPTYPHGGNCLPVPGRAWSGNPGASGIFRQDSSRQGPPLLSFPPPDPSSLRRHPLD